MQATGERGRVLAQIATLSSQLDKLQRRLIEIEGPATDTPADTAIQTQATARVASTIVEAAVRRQEIPAAMVSTTGLSVQPRKVPSEFEDRYIEGGELLGEGGMGEVRLMTDRRIGREVAMKVLLERAARSSRLCERFLFEARVQGQLEHPSIVPVYDLGMQADGSHYFTMKRVNGVTLHTVLSDLRKGARATKSIFSRRRLLLAFQSVCQAIEMAHQRGVIHRDLKPANIMLGEFGEVHVLDWGVAKLTIDPEVSPTPAATAALEEAHASTVMGEVLGTPGYMSPEQAAGDMNITPQSDVFSLGAILFEILTLQKLISREGNPAEDTLLRRYSADISARYPELGIPTLLSDLCVQATQHDPAKRTRSARNLFDTIERFLDGEGDLRRRRNMSRRLARDAMTSIADASSPEPGPPDARANALRSATQALALDPDNRAAMEALVTVATQLPAALTPEAEVGLKAAEDAALRKTALRGGIAYTAAAVNMLLVALLGVLDWLPLGLCCGLLVVAAGFSFLGSRMRSPVWATVPVIFTSTIGFAMTSLMFGPFTVAPLLCSLNVAILSLVVERWQRWICIVTGVVCVTVPVALQLKGWGPANWIFRDGIIELLPRVVAFEPVATTLFLLLVVIGGLIIPPYLIGAERDARAAAERKLALHAYQLSDLLPAEAKGQLMSVSIGDSMPPSAAGGASSRPPPPSTGAPPTW